VDLLDLSIMAEEWLLEENMSSYQAVGTSDPDATGVYTERGSYNGKPQYQTGSFPTAYLLSWDLSKWFIVDSATSMYIWDGPETENPEGEYTATPGVTGTLTVTEISGETRMPQLIYYKPGVGADRCIRLIRPKTKEVWKDAVGLVESSSVPGTNTQAETSIAITYDEGLHGYPIEIPSDLPVGEYDLVIMNIAKANVLAATVIEFGFGFKWNGQNMKMPIERFVDRLG
jgi:hypothetical protein